MKIYILHIITLLMLCPSLLIGQVKFYVQANPSAQTGQTIEIRYVVENGKPKKFKPPGSFDGFNILQGPNQMSNFSWNNGVTTSSTTYSYYVQAHKEGSLSIPSTSVEVKGKKYTSKPFTIEVSKGKTVAPQKNVNSQEEDWEAQVENGIFVRLYADKDTVYVGEQVTVYAKLYRNITSYNTQPTTVPSFNGFWKHDLPFNDQPKSEVFDSVAYKTTLWGKYALFPQKDGILTIDPVEAYTVVRIKSQQGTDPFDLRSFFNMGGHEDVAFRFQSDTLSIFVKPLPVENQPGDFSGAVGTFNYLLNAKTTKAKTGDAITLKSEVRGLGNLMMLTPPELMLTDDFEKFDPEVSKKISSFESNVTGSVNTTQLLIPQRPGTYDIASAPFTYFDVDSNNYISINLDPIQIEVSGPAINQNKTNIQEEGPKDLLYINTDINLNKRAGARMAWSSFIPLVSAGPALLFLFLLIQKRKKNTTANPQLATAKVVAKRLAKAKSLLAQSDKDAYYKEIKASLLTYLGDKLKIDRASLTKDRALKELLMNGVDCEEISSLLSKCDIALYSPLGLTDMEQDLDIAKRIITNIENVLG